MSGPTNGQVALAYTRRGWPVFPICWPTPEGTCGCGGSHQGRDIGKAPIGRLAPQGVKSATTNSATVDRWWRAAPLANVGIDLERSGLLMVDPDSPETDTVAVIFGVDGGAIRKSRHQAYVFTRPADCPTERIIKDEGAELDILASGYVVAHGTHRTGYPVRLDPDAQLAPAPAWAVERLRTKANQKAAQQAATAARRAERSTHGGAEPPVRLHKRGQQRWTGELVEPKPDGGVDRDRSLFYIALDLAECGASESAIIAALAERDETLGWRKFTGRSDAEARYGDIAEKAVARAVERERRHTTSPADTGVSEPSQPPAEVAADPGEICTLEDAKAEIHRMRRLVMNRDDLIGDQRIVITKLQAERDALKAKLGEIHALLAVPNRRLSPARKCLAIVVDNIVERTRPDEDGYVRIRYNDLAAKVGGSRSMVDREMALASTSVNRPTINASAPIWKSTKTVFQEVDGQQRPTSETAIAPKADGSILAAFLAYEPDEERNHGGKRLPICPDHPSADVYERKRMHCAVCHRPLGEEQRTNLVRQDDVVGADTRAQHTHCVNRLSVHQDDVVGREWSEPPIGWPDYEPTFEQPPTQRQPVAVVNLPPAPRSQLAYWSRKAHQPVAPGVSG